MLMNKQNSIFSDPDRMIGKEISGVTILGLLGRGASGLVYMAFQKSLKRKIAIKLIPKEENDDDSIMKIRDEAETVAVLNHPNIVTVFDVGETEEFLFITMQFIDGESLQSMIKRLSHHPLPSKRLLPVPKTLEIMISVLDALDYAHEQDIVHQDVKPGNVLIEGSSGRPFLVDFGIARTFVTEEDARFVRGTPLYIAPEQAKGETTDARADIYSAGVVVWECLAGSLPSPSLPATKLVGLKAYKPDSFFSFTPARHSQRIDFELEQIILKAISSSPEMRYQTCAQMRNELQAYLKSMEQR